MMDTIERQSDLDHALAVVRKAGFLAVSPRRSPDERAEEAVEQIAHQLVALSDAIRAGAELSAQKRANLAAFVTMLRRLGLVP